MPSVIHPEQIACNHARKQADDLPLSRLSVSERVEIMARLKGIHDTFADPVTDLHQSRFRDRIHQADGAYQFVAGLNGDGKAVQCARGETLRMGVDPCRRRALRIGMRDRAGGIGNGPGAREALHYRGIRGSERAQQEAISMDLRNLIHSSASSSAPADYTVP